MFRAGGLSLAMGNAAPEVQAAADFVTADNDADGFAKAVGAHILTAARAPGRR
jgi:hydroxymethylpyrimidine pyrophosphatase-like HAD family hydrolase